MRLDLNELDVEQGCPPNWLTPEGKAWAKARAAEDRKIKPVTEIAHRAENEGDD